MTFYDNLTADADADPTPSSKWNGARTAPW